MEKPNKKNLTFAIIFLLCILSSVGVMYYKYILQEDFVYFLTEEEVPEQFDLANYPE